MNPYQTTGKPVDQRFTAFCKEIEANFWNKYSQNGEDCIIEAIFKRFEPRHKVVVECGAADGLWFSNSRHLIENGWQGLLIEGDEETYEKLFSLYKADNNVALECRTVQAEGEDRFDAIFAAHGLPEDFGLLVIDVDGMDYYLFNSLVHYRPAVVICEYDPDADPMFVPPYGGPGQAGKDAIRYVGETAKNYVTLCATKTNLFFIRKDLAPLFTTEREDKAPGQLPPDVDGTPRLKVAAAMSTPRVGFLANMDCLMSSLLPFNISLARGEGAFWSQTLTRAIEKSLDSDPDYILTIDYDSIFTQKEVAQIVMLAHDNPWADVIIPMQQKREGGELLASTQGDVSLADRLLPLKYGHFGLTLFKADVFERLPRPWFYEKPDEQGRWEEGRIDADIGFWKNCEDNNIRVMLATDVVIGHLEQVVSVPDVNLKPLYISVYNYRAGIRPENMFSRQRVEEQIRTLDMG